MPRIPSKEGNGLASEEQHRTIPATLASESASLGAKFKHLYAKASSMKNKQEELKTGACLQG